MATSTSRSAFPTTPAARPRSVRSQCSAAAATAAHPSIPARLAQQLRQLKQFKVWDAPAATAGSSRSHAQSRGGRQPASLLQRAPNHGGPQFGAGARRPGVVWFRSDLRLHDNEALTRAAAECSSLLPVYVFDTRDYGKSPQGYDKTGPYRAQFLTEAVADLRARLRAAGSELVVRVGRAEEVIGDLVRRTGAGAVYCHTEVTYEELKVEAAVKAAAEGAGARLQAFWSNTLCHLEDLPFQLQQLPQNFDKFRERVEGAAVRAALPAAEELRGLPLGGRVDPGDIPTLKQLGLQPLPTASQAGSSGSSSSKAGRSGVAGGGGSPVGGESEALRQLQRFLAQAGGGGKAGQGQGPGPGQGSTAACGSNFANGIAPWLATGCLSPRRMLEDARRALGGAGAASAATATAPTAASASVSAAGSAPAPAQQQQQLTWVRFELLWRDFFRFMTLKYSRLSNAKLGTGASTATATGATAATCTPQPALAMA